MTLTQSATYYTNNQCGKLSRCFVRRPTPYLLSLSPYSAYTHTSNFSSQLEKCSVCPLALFSLPHVSDSDECFTGHPCWVGFIPILYSSLSARWRKPSIRLPDESPDDTLDGLSESQKFPPERLTGRRVLLLWLPAVCDLTGTTVRTFTLSSLQYAPRANHLCIPATRFYSS
jgi:hypothetical protein